VGGFVFTSDVTSGWICDSNTKDVSYNGTKITKRVKSGGVGKYGNRSIQFYTAQSGSLNLGIVSSNSSTATKATLMSSEGELVEEKDIATTIGVVTFSLPGAGVYSLYATGAKGINVFYGEVTNTGGGGGSTPTPTPDVPASPVADSSAIYVSSSALSTGTGTLMDPTSFENALLNVKAGGSILLKAGTYSYGYTVRIAYGNDGEANALKTIRKADGETGEVVFDFAAEALDSTMRGIELHGNYWHLKDLNITNAGDNGLFVSGNYNVIELCTFHENRDTGCQISRRVSTLSAMADWPHDNLIKNCTSFDNSDASGENADGFAAKLTCGPDNTFDGCISYANSDDGWDCYTKTATGPIGTIHFRNCLAMYNRYTFKGTTAQGDCNGFKLGGSKIEVNHDLVNCIAFGNGNHGFTDNSNYGTITISNCTSYDNSRADGKKSNFDLNRDKIAHHVMSSLLSVVVKSASDKYGGSLAYSILNNGGKYYQWAAATTVNGDKVGASSVTITPADTFVSTSAPEMTSSSVHQDYRSSDGSIKLGDFLKLKSSALAFTAGENSAPIGADLSGK